MAGEIRAGTDALAVELQERGVIVEDRLPDPTLAEYGQVVEELWPMLVSAAEPALAEVGRAELRSAVELSGRAGPAGPVYRQLGAVLRHL